MVEHTIQVDASLQFVVKSQIKMVKFTLGFDGIFLSC